MRLIGIALMASLCLAAPTAGAAAGAVTYAAAIAALESVKATLMNAIGAADTATAERIRQVETVIDRSIGDLRKLMKEGAAEADTLRGRSADDVANVLRQTSDMIQQSTDNAFEQTNNSLYNAYRLLNAIPLVSVPNTLGSVLPYSVLRTQGPSIPVSVRGFFPDVSKERPAFVTVLGKRRPMSLGVDNTLTFDMPAAELPPEEQFLKMSITLPVKRAWGLYYSDVSLAAKIYVRREKPFDFTYAVYSSNPEAWKIVAANRPLSRSANSGGTSNNGTLSAASLFSEVVDGALDYDAATATIVSWSRVGAGALTQGVQPCPRCTASTGKWSSTPTQVDWALAAPNCEGHWINPSGFFEVPYRCNGGGTNADLNSLPTFKVRKKGETRLEVVSSKGESRLQPHGTSAAITMPPGWTAVEISVKYRDGTERFEEFRRMTAGGGRASNGRRWLADIEGNALVLSSR